MRRMLDPTKVGGIPSTIEFDKDGNRTVDKNLTVNGQWLSPYAYNKWYNETSEMFTKNNYRKSVYMF